jgi:hypothetical protein
MSAMPSLGADISRIWIRQADWLLGAVSGLEPGFEDWEAPVLTASLHIE